MSALPRVLVELAEEGSMLTEEMKESMKMQNTIWLREMEKMKREELEWEITQELRAKLRQTMEEIQKETQLLKMTRIQNELEEEKMKSSPKNQQEKEENQAAKSSGSTEESPKSQTPRSEIPKDWEMVMEEKLKAQAEMIFKKIEESVTPKSMKTKEIQL